MKNYKEYVVVFSVPEYEYLLMGKINTAPTDTVSDAIIIFTKRLQRTDVKIIACREGFTSIAEGNAWINDLEIANGGKPVEYVGQ